MLVTRGFRGKRRGDAGDRLRLPPGQYFTPEFPVLTARTDCLRRAVVENLVAPVAAHRLDR